MFLNNTHQLIQKIPCGQVTGGIMREIDHQQLRLRRDEGLQCLQIQHPAAFFGRECPFANVLRANHMRKHIDQRIISRGEHDHLIAGFKDARAAR